MKFQEINPITGKKGKRYQYAGEKKCEKFANVTINEQECVLSSLGTLYVKVYDPEFVVEFQEIKPTTNKGYKIARVHDKSTKKSVRIAIHRKVAECFVPVTKTDEKKGRDIVLFKDGEKTNIKPENLMWVNAKELNRINSFNKKLKVLAEKHMKVSLDVVEMNEVKAFLVDEDGYTVPEIIKLLQIEKIDGIKDALTKKRKGLKK